MSEIEVLRDGVLVLENADDVAVHAPPVEKNGAGAKTKLERTWTILSHGQEIKTETGTTLSRLN